MRLRSAIFAIPALLSIPLIAMQFTEEVDWKVGDFTTMGVMLLIAALFITQILRRFKSKALLIFIVLATFFLIWAELGVGILGTPFAGH